MLVLVVLRQLVVVDERRLDALAVGRDGGKVIAEFLALLQVSPPIRRSLVAVDSVANI